MAGSFPRFRLYDETGTSLIYEFEKVTDESGIFQDPETFVEHTSLRGQGSIIAEGSDAPRDITLTFLLIDNDYEALVAQINALSTTIVKNTKYILKVDLTASTTKDIKVKRLEPMQFPITRRQKRVTLQDVLITFRAGSWA